MGKPVNIIGNKYGRWTVLERAENINRRTAWLCQCECGNKKIVKYSDLYNGRTKSCGCLRKDLVKEEFSTHKLSKHPLFKRWINMKTRCYNPKAINYKNYGGRGIRICNEWLHDFKKFYDWSMANGFKENLSIDRINNDGNYEPGNCRWATAKEQVHNRRSRNARKRLPK